MEQDTTALTARIEKLERELQAMRASEDIAFSESLRRRVLFDVIHAGVISSATSNEQTTTTVPSGGGSVSHAKQYDARVYVDIDGVMYYIGLYQ